MSARTERGIGLELIQREITLVLYENLNDELDLQQEKWEERDNEWAQITGLEPAYVLLEHVEAQNYHQGHRPSLILNDTPRESYPNVSVMAYQARPTEDIIDQGTNYNFIIDVETMVKSETSEAEVDSRIHRTCEAITQVLSRNESLNGKSYGWDEDPIVQLTDIFTRDELVSHGEKWFWQGAKIRYNMTRHSVLAS